jgi:hypothetical protein
MVQVDVAAVMRRGCVVAGEVAMRRPSVVMIGIVSRVGVYMHKRRGQRV